VNIEWAEGRGQRAKGRGQRAWGMENGERSTVSDRCLSGVEGPLSHEAVGSLAVDSLEVRSKQSAVGPGCMDDQCFYLII
jgi:hypothetical protein